MTKYFKKSVSLILSMLMVFSAFVPVFGATTASDYDNHWAKDVIQSAVTSGVVKGYPDGSFKPDNAITRAEFFTLVNNSMQFTASSAVAYTDVAANAWYAPVIARAQAAGYISGYPDGSIHPDGNITRQEAAVVLSRLKSLTAASSTLAFTDASAVGAWSKLAVIAVVEAKIMIGYPDGSFQPQAQIKRAEALVAINNGVNYPGISIITGTVYDKAGVFGSATESATIEGNVVIKAAGVTLQNTIVNGDLTITKDVGEGDVTLKNVTVKGDIHVNGGGVNSIYLIDVTAGKLYVMKDNGPVRIVASGTTEIDEVIVGSDVILEEVDLTGTGFVKITVEKNAAGGIDITLINVKLDSVDIMAEGVTLNMDKNSTIGTLTLDAKAAITGTGVVTDAVINASGVTFQTKPINMTVATDVTPPVITPPGTSGGGGGGGSTTTESVPVTLITVTGAGNVTTVSNGLTLQMSAAVTPTNATDPTIAWSITTPSPSIATIDETTGLLTATGVGTVTVVATNTASGVEGTLAITVTESTDATISGGTLNGVSLISGDSFAGGADIASSMPLTVVVTTGSDIPLVLVQGNSDSTIEYVINASADPDPIDTDYAPLIPTISVVTGDVIWLKVIAEDGVTKLYYMITVTVTP